MKLTSIALAILMVASANGAPEPGYVEAATNPDQPSLETIAATFPNVPYGQHERQVLGAC